MRPTAAAGGLHFWASLGALLAAVATAEPLKIHRRHTSPERLSGKCGIPSNIAFTYKKFTFNLLQALFFFEMWLVMLMLLLLLLLLLLL